MPVYAGIALLLTVTFLIPATKTWFAWIRESNAAGNGVTSAEVAAGAMPYVLYLARPKTNPITEIDHVEVYTNASDARLNTFDAIFGGDNNAYTSAYVRMPVYGIPEGKNIQLTVTCQSDYENGQHEIQKYVSNVIQMSCAVIPTSVIAENATSEQIYVGAKNYFQTNAASIPSDSFVNYTVTTTNGKKSINVTGKKTVGAEKGISFTIPANQIQLVNGKAYVYFKIDYNEDLIYHFVRTALWGKGGFKLGETAADDFAGTIASGDPMTYDLKEIKMTIID